MLKDFIEKGSRHGLLALSLLSLVTTVLVIGLLIKESAGFFSQVSVFDFLFGTTWQPLIEPRQFGVLPLVMGTMYIVIGAVAIALPLGVLIAVYLSQYASEKTRSWLKPALEVLAGIPTVVYGYFALSFITPLLQKMFEGVDIFNAVSGAIVVGIMIIPMISSICDDAFQALPPSLTEGAYALGATSLEVVFQIMIPAAAAHIWSAVVLAVSRAIGETMAVTLAAGSNPNLLGSPLESIQTMTAYIVQVSLGDVEHGGVEYLTSFAVALLLFAMTLMMNILGHKMVKRSASYKQ
jgi:phosphate transport system permease protein